MLLPPESPRAMDVLMIAVSSMVSFLFGILCGAGILAALDRSVPQCNRPHLVVLEDVALPDQAGCGTVFPGVPAPAASKDFMRPMGVGMLR